MYAQHGRDLIGCKSRVLSSSHFNQGVIIPEGVVVDPRGRRRPEGNEQLRIAVSSDRRLLAGEPPHGGQSVRRWRQSNGPKSWRQREDLKPSSTAVCGPACTVVWGGPAAMRALVRPVTRSLAAVLHLDARNVRHGDATTGIAQEHSKDYVCQRHLPRMPLVTNGSVDSKETSYGRKPSKLAAAQKSSVIQELLVAGFGLDTDFPDCVKKRCP